MSKIFLDAGHGAHDSGAVGKHSYEKDNVLKVALRVATLLRNAGHTVHLSRTTDVYLKLSERARRANAWGANYFISFHNNASTSNASGFETFIYNGSVSAATRKLQAAIHKSIINELKITDRGMKRANFAVLRETNMPSCLIEYGFISNDDDEQMLRTKVEQMAVSTAQGIVDYVGGSRIPSGVVASTNKPKSVEKTKGDDDELKFTSPALKSEYDLTIGSKARRDIIVTAAVDAGAHFSWLEKLENGTITDGDIVGLAMKYVVDTHVNK